MAVTLVEHITHVHVHVCTMYYVCTLYMYLITWVEYQMGVHVCHTEYSAIGWV